jgi:hypothetical protein
MIVQNMLYLLIPTAQQKSSRAKKYVHVISLAQSAHAEQSMRLFLQMRHWEYFFKEVLRAFVNISMTYIKEKTQQCT